MKDSLKELSRKLDFLAKEIIDLKRESHKTFLLNKQNYTVKESASVSSLSEPYLYSCITNGLLPHSRPTPNRILIKRRELNQFLKSNHHNNGYFNI